MAGRGQRFRDAGFETPKPLIDVLGLPMYAWALAGMPLALATSLTFVCLDEHLQGGTLKSDISVRFAAFEPTVVALDRVTDGQACTVLMAIRDKPHDIPLLVFNADTYAVHGPADIAATAAAGLAGALGTTEAEGDHWSFVELGPDGLAVRTAEKVRISSLACTGLYYFGSTQLFVDVTLEAIRADDRANGEFYVAPLYNRIIARGGRVTAIPSTEFYPLGTPVELAEFLANPPPNPSPTTE